MKENLRFGVNGLLTTVTDILRTHTIPDSRFIFILRITSESHVTVTKAPAAATVKETPDAQTVPDPNDQTDGRQTRAATKATEEAAAEASTHR